MTRRWITVQLKLTDGEYNGDSTAAVANRNLVAPAEVDLSMLGAEITRLLFEMVGTVVLPSEIVAIATKDES